MYVYKNTRTLKKFSHKRYKIIWVGAAGFIDTPLSRSAGACASNLSIFFLDFAIRRVRYGFDRITSGSLGVSRLFVTAPAYKARPLSDSMVVAVPNYLMVCLSTTTASSDVASLNSLGICHASSGVLKVGYKVQVTKVRILYDVSVHAAWNWNDSARSISYSAFRI